MILTQNTAAVNFSLLTLIKKHYLLTTPLKGMKYP